MKKLSTFCALTALFLASLTATSRAQVVINLGNAAPPLGPDDISDFQAPEGAYNSGGDFTDTNLPGQSFTTGGSSVVPGAFTLTSIVLQEAPFGSGGNFQGGTLNLSIYSGVAGTLLSTQTFAFAGDPGGNGFFQLVTTPLQLASDTQYSFIVTTSQGYLGLNGGYPSTDTYAGGTAFFGGDHAALGYDRSFGVTLTANTVPEPSTWAMMAGGLLALIAIQRRRLSV